MAHGTLLPEQTDRIEQMCSVAAEMTDPERGQKKNPKATVKITFWDGFPREFSLELTEKAPVPERVKQKSPGMTGA